MLEDTDLDTNWRHGAWDRSDAGRRASAVKTAWSRQCCAFFSDLRMDLLKITITLTLKNSDSSSLSIKKLIIFWLAYCAP